MRFLHLRLIYACTCSLLVGLIQIPGCSDPTTQLIDPNSLSAQPLFMSGQQVCEVAKSITVIIMSADGKSEGTGFLIHQKPNDNRPGFFLYKVVTNAHVVTKEDDYLYNIQTPDGAIHQARQFFRFGEASSGDDLAILQFESNKADYEIALARTSSLVPNQDRVIAAGFPIRTGAATQSEWVCTEPGEVSFVLQPPMKGGYGIGYVLDIRKGMSGGPLLNLQGEVVGINGRHRNPLFGARRIYTYENGNPVNEPLDLLKESSWAIPMETLVRLAFREGIPVAYNDTPNQPQPIDFPSEQDPSDSDRAGTISPDSEPKIKPQDNNFSCQPSDYENVEQIAQKISVKVLIGNHQRSGIIIEQQGQNYKVLTYEGLLADGYYSIQTNDGQNIPTIEPQTIIYGQNRFVVLEFSSQDTAYEVASRADLSSLKVGEQVFAAGYSWVLESSESSRFQFKHGQIKILQESNDNQRLAVSNSINEGFVGGPLLNCQGKLIGILDRQKYVNSGWTSPSDAEPQYKYSWATPIQEVYPQLNRSNANSYEN